MWNVHESSCTASAFEAFLFVVAQWSRNPCSNGLSGGRGDVLFSPSPLRLGHLTLPRFWPAGPLPLAPWSVTGGTVQRMPIPGTLYCHCHCSMNTNDAWLHLIHSRTMCLPACHTVEKGST